MNLHAQFEKVCRDWDDYLIGKLGVDAFGSVCSCGCEYFHDLIGVADWGICLNPESLRAGLLTWEHQGCPNIKGE